MPAMNKLLRLVGIAGCILLCLGCVTMSNAARPGEIRQQPFGKTREGVPVSIYTLRNANGCEARITNYGGIVVSLTVPDRNGRLGDVALGNDTLATYIANNGPYFGALIGRYSNRIAMGRFTLDGKQYQLATNNPPN